jgi:hypothetical protein
MMSYFNEDQQSYMRYLKQDVISRLQDLISPCASKYKVVPEHWIHGWDEGRPEEGKILSREDIDRIGYDFGLLTRIS